MGLASAGSFLMPERGRMFSQLLRYPAFYAVIGLAGFGFGVWFRRSRWVTAGRPGLDPRIGGI
ncbi:hypothetical protein PROPHIGD02-2_104 [Mycobacterium phage prophiGD02-2]|nr:hypothetical protein PROPHIGD02-2_104 [Mycobacterium phage prophiGD02-2]QST87374.1 hypothetical protein PROPHIGD90-1_104 [Mycobacterium phage prophiGD90-1]